MVRSPDVFSKRLSYYINIECLVIYFCDSSRKWNHKPFCLSLSFCNFGLGKMIKSIAPTKSNCHGLIRYIFENIIHCPCRKKIIQTLA